MVRVSTKEQECINDEITSDFNACSMREHCRWMIDRIAELEAALESSTEDYHLGLLDTNAAMDKRLSELKAENERLKDQLERTQGYEADIVAENEHEIFIRMAPILRKKIHYWKTIAKRICD